MGTEKCLEEEVNETWLETQEGCFGRCDFEVVTLQGQFTPFKLSGILILRSA